MNISIVICTWNRAELLDKTLSCMGGLRIPKGIEYEIVVVNNNSTDHTDAITNRHSMTLPIKRLHEPKQGLSSARNCAVNHADGDWIVWTDDDVLVDVEWLAEYVKVFEQFPQHDFFGGTVDPWFENDPPAWLQSALSQISHAYAICNHGDQQFPLSASRLPFGANYCIRTDVQKAHLYDTQLGRSGGNMLSGEETAVLKTMISNGHTGLWVPNAKVKHFIPTDRQTISYIRRYYEGHGALMASDRDKVDVPHLFGRPRWLWRAWIASEIDYYVGRACRSPEKWVDSLKRAATWKGCLRQAE